MQIIDNTITANRVFRLQNEIRSLELGSKGVDNNPKISDRIKQIKKILADLDSEKSKTTSASDKLNEHKLKMKQAVYQTRWPNLSADQKLNRLSEYLDRMLITDNNIKNTLSNMITSGDLKTKDVNYKIDIGKIVSLSVLKVENNNFALNLPDKNKTNNKTNNKASKTVKASNKATKTVKASNKTVKKVGTPKKK